MFFLLLLLLLIKFYWHTGMLLSLYVVNGCDCIAEMNTYNRDHLAGKRFIIQPLKGKVSALLECGPQRQKANFVAVLPDCYCHSNVGIGSHSLLCPGVQCKTFSNVYLTCNGSWEWFLKTRTTHGVAGMGCQRPILAQTTGFSCRTWQRILHSYD